MTEDRQHSGGGAGRPVEKGKPGEKRTEDAGEDSCRCKEVSKKTLPEMFMLMLSDLAFWKKPKDRK
jgi:hypothetical protein